MEKVPEGLVDSLPTEGLLFKLSVGLCLAEDAQ